MERCDVLIAGAGLAGLELARQLARRGLDVVLAERKRDPGSKVQTTGIFVRRTFDELDLPPRCLGVPIRTVTLYSPSRRRRLTLRSAKDEFRIGRMPELYRHLLRSCVELGVRFLPSTSYAGVTTGPSGSTVRLETSDGATTLDVAVLVGADGARSRVAADLGLDVNRRFLAGVEEVFPDPLADAEPELHCFLDPHLAPGYLAWIARDGGEVHVGLAGHSARFDPSYALRAFLPIAAEFVPFDSAARIERRGGLIPVGGIHRRIANRHGLLVGDAAGAVSPLTAGGLDACMRMPSHVADLIELSILNGDRRSIERFHGRELRARFASRLWMRRVLDFASSSVALTELGSALLTAAPFRAIARHVFFGRSSFPDRDAKLGARGSRLGARG
ncbi:MAG: NAD(P)/FAD-dependent oxidoreductase [Thermoanaerobaculia bacterium]